MEKKWRKRKKQRKSQKRKSEKRKRENRHIFFHALEENRRRWAPVFA